MNSPNRFAAALLMAGALAACSDAPTGAAPATDDATLARQVAALGFRADMIEDHGDFVLVEGDIRLSRTQLRAGPNLAPTDPLRPRFQYRTFALVGSPAVHQIVVDLSGLASEPGWAAAARDAMTAWNAVPNSYVRMVEGSPANISVGTNCGLAANVAAQASWPSGGNPGPTIHVNPCFGWTINHAQRLHNMVHEFGHTLGFRHSNYTQIGESAGTLGAVHVSGTPTGIDNGSVMNGGTALNQWAGFSAHDVTAIVRLYPLPAVPGAVSTDAGGQVRLTWNAVPGAISYDVQRVEERAEDDFYANTVTMTITEGPWLGPLTAIPFDTGSPWTGVTHCVWSMAWQSSDMSTYFYRIIANFANGSSATYVSVYAYDATC